MDLLAEIISRLDRMEERQVRMEKVLLGRLKESEWITKREAMELLNCKDKTLRKLVLAGTIQVNSNPKQGLRLRYSRTSINKYLGGSF